MFGDFELSLAYSFLTLQELASCSFVCKQWNRLAQNERIQTIFRDYAFGIEKWNNYLGFTFKEEDPLPDNIYKVLTEKKGSQILLDTHRLVFIPKGLSLDLLQKQLLAKYPKLIFSKKNQASSFTLYFYNKIGSGYWILISKTVEIGENHELASQSNRRKPHLIEAASSLFIGRIFNSKKSSKFFDNPLQPSGTSNFRTLCIEQDCNILSTPSFLTIGGDIEQGLEIKPSSLTFTIDPVGTAFVQDLSSNS